MVPAKSPLYADIAQAADAAGFLCRGGFHPVPEDRVPGAADDGRASLVLLGNAGPAMWRAFRAAGGTAAEVEANPLDSWTRRTLAPLARDLGATALFPFDGPPYLPFQTWAAKAEGLAASPLGILIHPDFGLWHAYRAALLFERGIDLPQRSPPDNPCARCRAQPCLKGCPVDAFTPGGGGRRFAKPGAEDAAGSLILGASAPGRAYDVPACVRYLDDPLGAACVGFGCLARHACPVGRDFASEPAQTRFHMQAFLRANGGKAR